MSNTAETKPSPSAVCHEAAGSFSTGIIEAAVTSASRKIVPLKVSGITFQSGARRPAVRRMTAQTAIPRTGSGIEKRREFQVGDDVRRQRGDENGGDDEHPRRVDLQAFRRIFLDRRVALLLDRRRHGEDQHRDDGRDIGLHDAERADARDPHHRRGGVADDAAGAAGIRGCDDRREIADVNLALEHVPRNGAADQRGGDVVEEARQHEHQDQQHDAAPPVVRQQCRHRIRNPALLEMPGQQRKSHQQQEQVAERDPLMRHVVAEAAEAGAVFEAGEDELVDDDDGKARQRDLKRLVMEQRDTQQRQRKQDEVDGYSEHKDWFDHHVLEWRWMDAKAADCALFQRLQPAGDFADGDVGLLQQLAHGEEAVELAGKMPVRHGHAGFL